MTIILILNTIFGATKNWYFEFFNIKNFFRFRCAQKPESENSENSDFFRFGPAGNRFPFRFPVRCFLEILISSSSRHLIVDIELTHLICNPTYILRVPTTHRITTRRITTHRIHYSPKSLLAEIIFFKKEFGNWFFFIWKRLYSF